MNGLEQTDLQKDNGQNEALQKDPATIKREFVEQTIRFLQWLFGWTPKSVVMKIGEIGEKYLPQRDDLSDDEMDTAGKMLKKKNDTT